MSTVLDLYTPELWARLPAPKVTKGWLTGVGSRETPENACRLLTILAGVTYSLGYRWRSGGAAGADEAVEKGVLTHPHYRPGESLRNLTLEIYLPWNGFEPIKGGPKKHEDVTKGYINSQTLPKYQEARERVLTIHPLRDKLREKQGAWALHSRNMFQPLGQDLRTASKNLYCWAPPKGEDDVDGGTRTAWQLAKASGIPTVNLHDGYSQSQILEFLERYAKTVLT